MTQTVIEIPEHVRRTALLRGTDGAAWLAGLPELVRALAREWELVVGRSFPGGTEAVVVEATMADGTSGVLKLAIPGLDPTGRELRTLLAVNGKAYVQVLRHDAGRGAMLLERLGPQLHELGLSLEDQIEIICATLKQAWRPLPEGLLLMSGAQKANRLASYIETTWPQLGKPCSERAIDNALRFAQLRRRAFDPEHSVLAHGDAHAWNTLLVPGDGPRRFKFVDPDGLFVERAYDLGIAMREWSAELLAGDPLELGRWRCHRLAQLTGVEPEPIWQWGFIERLSNGLLLKQEGMDDLAQACLAAADALALGGP